MKLKLCWFLFSEQIEIQSGRNKPAHHRIMDKSTVLGIEQIADSQLLRRCGIISHSIYAGVGMAHNKRFGLKNLAIY